MEINQEHSPKVRAVLTLAGSDSGGGAGIQADIKAISANGGYAACVISALTAQNTQGVQGIYPIPIEFIVQQLDSVLSDIKIDAIKIGMLGDRKIIQGVSKALRSWLDIFPNLPIVLDPVMVAKGGDRLLSQDAVEVLRNELLPLASLMTPNLPEAQALLNQSEEINSLSSMEEAGRALMRLGAKAVLLKGGHLASNQSPDFLIHPHHEYWLPTDRVKVKNTHGTGCTLSSAIATHLAKGMDIYSSCLAGKHYLNKCLLSADRLQIGKGIGPVDHFGLAAL